MPIAGRKKNNKSSFRIGIPYIVLPNTGFSPFICLATVVSTTFVTFKSKDEGNGNWQKENLDILCIVTLHEPGFVTFTCTRSNHYILLRSTTHSTSVRLPSVEQLSSLWDLDLRHDNHEASRHEVLVSFSVGSYVAAVHNLCVMKILISIFQ